MLFSEALHCKFVEPGGVIKNNFRAGKKTLTALKEK